MNSFLARSALVLGATAALTSFAQQPSKAAAQSATAELKDNTGKSVGTVRLEETPSGVLLAGDVSGIPAGDHAIHFHMVGKCEGDFKSAGDHFNPAKKEHGLKNQKGHHAGDLPNLTVPSDGKLKFELVTNSVSLKKGKTSLFDADGSAVVVHAKADDHASQPAGAAGDRIACGVVEVSTGGMMGATGADGGMGSRDGGTTGGSGSGGGMMGSRDGGMK